MEKTLVAKRTDREVMTQFSAETMDIMRMISYEHKGDIEEYRNAYPYIPQHYFIKIIDLLETLEINSFVDMGCGIPIIPYLVKLYYPHMECAGVEVRKEMMQKVLGFRRGVEIIIADMLKLPKKTIQKYDCIYMYNPIANPELMEQFCKKLIKEARAGQYILSYGTNGFRSIEASKKFENISGPRKDWHPPYFNFDLVRRI